jgi:hypothetical protein
MNTVFRDIKDDSKIEFLQDFDKFQKGEIKKIYGYATWPVDNLLICTFGYKGKCYNIPTSIIKVI